MSHAKGAYRASGSWDDLSPPRPRSERERTPPLVPWGLGEGEPAAPPDAADLFLCVTCWEWHAEGPCAPPRRRAR